MPHKFLSVFMFISHRLNLLIKLWSLKAYHKGNALLGLQ